MKTNELERARIWSLGHKRKINLDSRLSDKNKYDVDFIELFIESDLMMLSRNILFVHGFHDEWFL